MKKMTAINFENDQKITFKFGCLTEIFEQKHNIQQPWVVLCKFCKSNNGLMAKQEPFV